MVQNNLIRVIIFSYKNKNLESVVKSVIDNATSPLCIDVIDKNPIDRRDIFSKYDNLSYQHIMWTKVDSPTEYKNSFLSGEEFDYFLILSDDIILKENWDKELLGMCNNDMIISGNGKTYLYNKNKFFLGKTVDVTKDLTLTNYIDRNIIFGSASTFAKISYPINVKYFGEEETLSVNAFCEGIDVYSLPSDFYDDLGARTIENIYTPFSKQHNYNSFITLINDLEFGNIRKVKDFVKYHRIELSNIHELPFARNDVDYDNENALRKDKGEKFFDRRGTV